MLRLLPFQREQPAATNRNVFFLFSQTLCFPFFLSLSHSFCCCCCLFFVFIFLPDRPEKEVDGKRNILLGRPDHVTISLQESNK